VRGIAAITSFILVWVVFATPSSAGIKSEYERVGDFEIQLFPMTEGNWFDAAMLCAAEGEGRLCRPAEWIAACRLRAFKPVGIPEWVDQLTSGRNEFGSKGDFPKDRFDRDFLALVLFPDCERGIWVVPSRDVFPVRCCRD